MTPTSLAAPRTGKIIKNGFRVRVFERGENLLQNGILHIVFKLSQSSEIVYKVTQAKIFQKGAWHLKG